MKHGHVSETLVYLAPSDSPAGSLPEGALPWHAIADPDLDPVEIPARRPVAWDGAAWAELDPATGAVLARGVSGHTESEGL